MLHGNLRLKLGLLLINAIDPIVFILEPLANSVPECFALFAIVELPVMNACAARIAAIHGIVQAIGKHVIAQHALAGGGICVGVEEAAPGGVVITALEIIEPGFLDTLLAGELIFDLSNALIHQQIIPGVGR